jgi:hypothetical protein
MLPADSPAAAEQSRTIITDPRVRHFYDPERRAGEAVARSLGATAGKVAWDIYLFYAAGSAWLTAPPLPVCWAHQLTGSDWADAAHYHSGEDLLVALRESMLRITETGGG